jgi:tetratricopeptide (TPR) repeat protein
MVVGDTEGFREKGIDEINLAISKGKYVNDEAKIILATDIYMDFDDNDKAALPLLNEITAKYPGNHFLKLHLIECYRNLNKYELALQTAEDLVQSESLKKNKYLINRLYYNIGSAYLKLNESEKAIMAFKSALEAPQYKASSLYYIGYSYEMMRRIDKAYEYYYQIEESDDKNLYKSAKSRMDNPLTLARIKFIKGTNYLECGKYTQAAEILNNLIKVELKKEKPDKMFMANVYFNIGRVEYELKEYERAIQTFQKVLDSNDVKADFVKPWCHYYLENIYRDTGKTEKAKKEYDAAYKHEGKVLRPLIEEARKKMQ